MLLVGCRFVLINLILLTLPLFMLLFFKVPCVFKKIDYRVRFFWKKNQHKMKCRLVKWGIPFKPKIQGELGIQNLGMQNKCLSSKWLFKLFNEECIWQNLNLIQKIPKKYYFKSI